MAKKPQPVTWQIVVIRKKAEPMGTVEAPNADAAMQAAIKQFQITDPIMQKRLAARRLG